MIGVFDSWLWGVQTLQYLREILPSTTFCYLGDTAYVPYGERSGEWIRERTFQCLERLFAQWCVLVIMACNTASAYALRERQELYPTRKVLSVTVPGVEALVAWDFHKPLLLGTKVTIETHIYELVRQRAFPNYQVQRAVQIGAWRVDALESWASQATLEQYIQRSDLWRFVGKVDCVILGCTHYPLVKDLIASYLPAIPLLDPAYEAAKKLQWYLERHQELAVHVWVWVTERLRLFVTGNGEQFAQKLQVMWWVSEHISKIDI